MRSSLKFHGILIFIFASLIPVIVAGILTFAWSSSERSRQDAVARQSAQQTQFIVFNVLQRIETIAELFSQSREMSDFVQSPRELREFSRNLLFGRWNELRGNAPEAVRWSVLDPGGNSLFAEPEDQPGEPAGLPPGFSLTADGAGIHFVKALKFDDQGLSGPAASTRGNLVLSIPVDRLKANIPDLDRIAALPASLKLEDIQVSLTRGAGRSGRSVGFYLVVLIGTIGVSTVLGNGLAFRAYGASARALQAELVERSRLETFSQIASQVAHDIRSPLAALDATLGDASELPEEVRDIVRHALGRIRDIANDLLSKRKALNRVAEGDSSARTTELLSNVVDMIVTEKRIQFRSRLGIEIRAGFDEKSYGLFASIESQELKRVLSNLINNSVEAIESTGTVSVGLSCEGSRIRIEVADTGAGIAPELLAKLGHVEVSSGKDGTESGTGLGLRHAKSALERWGGSLEIRSTLGRGTSVVLWLPRAAAPGWFLPRLELAQGTQVVVLDDDLSVHATWSQRLEPVLRGGSEEIHHFSTPAELESWHASSSATTPTLYLVDYELAGQQKTGLSVIQELGIAASSVLITSRFEERHIRGQCEALGLKLLPKGMVGLIGIQVLG